MAQDRTRRLFKLLELLRTESPCDAGKLSETLQISRRTLFRDLSVLVSAGVRITYDRRSSVYRLEESSLLPAVTFSLHEVLALVSATRGAAPSGSPPGPDHLASAEMKLESILPADFQERAASTIARTDHFLLSDSDQSALHDTMEEIRIAISSRRKLWIRYDSPGDSSEIEHIVYPQRLLYALQSWYLVAYSEQRRQMRTFKLERILELRVEARTFERIPSLTREH